tara:strand:- start:761 stop:1615 length:855 start_codon:yes stop_codon:yes gene_type:complete
MNLLNYNQATINPYNSKNILLNKNNIQNILKKYGVFDNINNLGIYQQAFVHDSYSISHINRVLERDNVKLVKLQDGIVPLQKSNYERLEYLGDAIIESIISNYLFIRFNTENEGFLSRLRVSLVNRMMLAHLARTLNLGKYMIISRTIEDKESGRIKESNLEDIFEAFIGALFLDFNKEKKGYQIAEKFLINLLEDECTEVDIVEHILDDGNYKGKLVKYFKKIHKSSISFRTIESIGNSGDKEITVEVIQDNQKKVLGIGKGCDLKHAQQDACKKTLLSLKLI